MTETTRIHELNPASEIIGSDLLAVVKTPSTVPDERKATFDLVASFLGMDRFDFFVNVQDAAYGAVGDGATNDLAAIDAATAAAAAAGGGFVFFPPGVYRTGVSASTGVLIDVPSNVHLVGAGSTAAIIESGSTQAGHAVVGFSSVSNASVRSLGIRAVGDTNDSKGVYMEGASNCHVDDCQISDDFGWGTYISLASINCGVKDSVILGTTNGHGVEINGASYCYVDSTRIVNAGDTAGVSNAVEIYDASANRVAGIRVTNNYIETPKGYGVLAAGLFDGAIEGNTIKNPGSGGIGLGPSAFDATRLSTACTVAGNTILGADTLAVGPSGAIHLGGAGAKGCTVIGNTVRDSKNATAGIYVGGINNAILGNTCTLNGAHGININTTATGTVVVGNSCCDNSVTTAGSYHGIVCTADGCTIAANTCSDTRGGSARQYHGVNNSGANCRLIGNVGTGNQNVTVNNTGATPTLVGNTGITADVISAATDTAAGAVELATTAEATTGTDTTRAVTPAGVKAAIDALIASAPGALNTLDELAAALGDDANFAATVTTALAAKVATTRTISTTAPLTGGGDLSANRTLAIDAATTAAAGAVELATTAETQTGSDATRAVTPAGGAATYKPLAGDLISLPATAFNSQGGAPTLTFDYTSPVWLLDGSNQEQVGSAFTVPPGWNTFNVIAYWINMTAGTGNVRWQGVTTKTAAGASTHTFAAASVTAAALGQYLLAKTTLLSGIACTPGDLMSLVVYRVGNDALDTLNATDIGLIAVEIVRAT